MTLARVIARVAPEEIEFLFGHFKMASKFFSFDLAYLLNGCQKLMGYAILRPPLTGPQNWQAILENSDIKFFVDWLALRIGK